MAIDRSTMKTTQAFIFPGQAAQAVGMGKDLFDHSPAAREVFNEVDDTLGRSLTTLMFEGSIEELTETSNAQPAVSAVSLASHAAMTEALGAQPVPFLTAGHSLGEYSALAVSGVLSVSDTIRLVVQRSRLMQEACDERPGGMVALIGIDEFAVEDVCRETGAQLSNINTAQQIIISGDHRSLAQAIDLAAARGAKRCIPLQVGGAFHSGLMQPAQSGLNEVIDSVKFNDPVVPIVGNCGATALTTGAEVKAELMTQLTSCVRWQRSVEFMIESGVETFVEVGPGNVLAGMIKRIDSSREIISVGDMESVRSFAAA
ncbi:MAG: ACP S-malonyltransferase [Chloroflexi bacterium]|nr:ACP S-malonyltransferase [Chloroflexota bacterium]